MSRKADRREFLKTGLITTAAAMTAGPAIILNPDSVLAQTYPDIVVSHGANPEVITRRAVEALGGMKRFVKPGNKVVIKPNMSFASGPLRLPIPIRRLLAKWRKCVSKPARPRSPFWTMS